MKEMDEKFKAFIEAARLEGIDKGLFKINSWYRSLDDQVKLKEEKFFEKFIEFQAKKQVEQQSKELRQQARELYERLVQTQEPDRDGDFLHDGIYYCAKNFDSFLESFQCEFIKNAKENLDRLLSKNKSAFMAQFQLNGALIYAVISEPIVAEREVNQEIIAAIKKLMNSRLILGTAIIIQGWPLMLQ